MVIFTKIIIIFQKLFSQCITTKTHSFQFTSVIKVRASLVSALNSPILHYIAVEARRLRFGALVHRRTDSPRAYHGRGSGARDLQQHRGGLLASPRPGQVQRHGVRAELRALHADSRGAHQRRARQGRLHADTQRSFSLASASRI